MKNNWTKSELISLIRQIAGNQRRTGKGGDGLQIKASDISGFSSGSGLNGFQIFTSSGTFTASTGFTNFFIQAVGAGLSASGIGSGSTGATDGGASATYCESLITLTSGSSISVTIGSTGGADTSFGSLLVAPGAGSATSPVGTFQIAGQAGGINAFGSASNSIATSGTGGSTPLGFGGNAVSGTSSTNINGLNATGYGAGGSGCVKHNAGGAAATGGSFSPGLVKISW